MVSLPRVSSIGPLIEPSTYFSGSGSEQRLAGGTRRSAMTSWLLVTLGACVGCEDERDRVSDLIHEMAREVPVRASESTPERKLRVEEQVAPHLTEEFQLVAPWLEQPEDRRFAVVAIIGLPELAPVVSLDLRSVDVELSASGRRAVARGTARISDSQVADLHGFDLPYTVDLRKVGPAWRLVRVTLDGPQRGLPEARP